jgi:peptidoglycan/xylan/chitin deacetylase (PgdA/CDA1 family)
MPVIMEPLRKKRPWRHWHAWAVLAVLTAVALGAGALVWAGRDLPPPKFQLTRRHLLTPVGYPLWRRASDWLAGRHYIALTFDDGPGGHGVDARILDILARHHAHAVFFEVCAHINSKTHDIPKRILASGNLLGNHSYDHLDLSALSAIALKHQTAGCSDKLESITGVRPSLFRPPWGQLSPAATKAIHAAGMHIVLWDANSGDTWLKSPDQIIRMSLYEASLGGHVLLLHSRSATAESLDTLLTQLQRRGYRFVLPSTGREHTGG